jgi:predicted RecB family nuclease
MRKDGAMKAPQLPTNHVTLGGYAAKQCHEMLRKEMDPTYLESDKDPMDPFTLAIMAAGNEYEGEVVGPALLAAFKSHVIIDTTTKMGPKRAAAVLAEAREKTLVFFVGDRSEESLCVREMLTHELAEKPGKVRLLWNPRLRKWKKDARGKVVWANRSAEPDVMYRQGSRITASPRWSSIDVKFHHPFEGKKKGLLWNMSTLAAPYPEKATAHAWEGTLKEVDALQLAHYHRSLEFHGLAGNPVAGIIGKPLDDEFRVVWVDLNDKLYERATESALSLYDAKFAAVLAVAHREVERLADPSLEPLSSAEWKSECQTCVWRTTCHDELSLADHITLLPGITPARAREHYAVGVSDVHSLASLDTKTAMVVDAGVADLADLIEAAKSYEGDADASVDVLVNGRGAAKQLKALQAAGVTTLSQLARLDAKTAQYSPRVFNLVNSIDQARVVEYARVRKQTHVFMARGVDHLEIPKAKVEIHVDMENDEHIYLWGVRVVWHENDRVRTTHKAISSFEANDAAEAQVTVEFWEYLQELITKANARHGEGNVLVFHYTAAEDRCLRSLAKKHAGVKGVPSLAEVDAFLESDVWVDLAPVLTKQLVWPTEDHTLKSLAKYARFIWRDNDPSGSNSVVWYQRAIDPDEPNREEWQTRIIEYNEDDCEATAVLLAWLQRFGEVDNLSRKLSSVTELEDPKKRGARRR